MRRVICLAAFVLIAAGGVFGQSKKDQNQARSLIQEGDKAFTAKNYREAAEKYGQALVLVPTNASGHYKKGFSHFELKEPDIALTEFATALSQGYSPIEIYRVRAYICAEQKNWDSALEDTKKGLALVPNDLPLLKELGSIYLAKAAYPDALDVLKRVADAAPADADVQYDLARVYFAMGDAKLQQISADAALARGTHFPGEAFYLLGDAHQKLGHGDQAADAYKRSIAVNPKFYDVYRNLSELYRSEGNYAEAIKASKMGLLAFPADGGFYTDLSWYYSLADRPQDAVEAGRSAVAMLPQQAMGYTNLCRAYNDVKSYDLAISACNSALRLNPGDGETNFYLGRAYNLTGRNAEATKYYGLAVKGLEDFTSKNADYSDGWYLLGNAYFANDQRDQAIGAYLKCLRLSPRFVKAHYNLGVIYTITKNKTAATEQYDALRTLDPKLAEDLKTRIDKM